MTWDYPCSNPQGSRQTTMSGSFHLQKKKKTGNFIGERKRNFFFPFYFLQILVGLGIISLA